MILMEKRATNRFKRGREYGLLLAVRELGVSEISIDRLIGPAAGSEPAVMLGVRFNQEICWS